MDMMLHEMSFKYERWLKFVLVFPVILMAGAGLILSGLVPILGILPEGLDGEMRLSGFFMIGGAAFTLFIYWLMLPVKVLIHTDKLRIQYGRFFWTIPFETIESVRAAKGLPGPGVQGSVTSFKTQVEISRRKGRAVRISPEHRDEFLDRTNQALEDWRRFNTAVNTRA